MSDDPQFALALIAAEEARREQDQQPRQPAPAGEPEFTPEVQETADTTHIIDRSGMTAHGRFIPADPNTQVDFPITGPGTLDALIVDSPTPSFSIYVEDGNKTLYENTYSDLKSISGELPYIAAYERGGAHILTITDRSFSNDLFVLVRPDAPPITFSRVRAEVTAPPESRP